jgi:hypothetical protein
MRRGYLFLSVFALGAQVASAQDLREAYNLSALDVQGTARSMGFGNALGSVGGDFSSLSVNPAGIGVYRSSEISFTPALDLNAASGQYMGNTSMENSGYLVANNFGLVLTHAPHGRHYDRANWKTFSFAIGVNKLADFNNEYSYHTDKNTNSSASQAFESDANRAPGNVAYGNSNLGSLGYESYLLNTNSAGQYYSIVPFGGGVTQTMNMQTSGGINEAVLSFGGNFKEKLMLGITLGMPIVDYHQSASYSEALSSDNNAVNPYGFSYFNYSNGLDISGAGVNAKIGAIYKVNDMFRVGLAFHSPTYYSISDRSGQSITTSHSDSVVYMSSGNGDFPFNRFDYNFTTPWKGVLSATIMLNKFGFITADYEYVDYSSMRYYYGSGFDEANGLTYRDEQDAMNQMIKKTYQGASNFRLGAEGRFSKYFMGRLGFGYYGNPYTSYGQSTQQGPYTTQRIDVSAGVGFRYKHFFTDLGYIHSMYQGYEQPYTIDYTYVVSGTASSIPTAKINFNMNTLAWTVGFKF